jgi:putative protease
MKVDALLIQDFGVLSYVRKNYPDFVCHASTQMNIYDLAGALKAKEMGFSRVVLAREASLAVAKEIIQAGLEVEVFGHGALCFASSGNCYLSSSIGGRSGNRGKCAQPCRKKYRLLKNGVGVTSFLPLLSMKDLCTIDEIKALKEAGITSLKIEGRMKKSDYVYAVVEAYRYALDHDQGNLETYRKNLLVSFNRGFTKGHLLNDSNANILNQQTVNHQGLVIGTVKKKTPTDLVVSLTEELRHLDGIRLVTNNGTTGFLTEVMKDETGKTILSAKPSSTVFLHYVGKLSLPCQVVKTSSSFLEASAKQVQNHEEIHSPVDMQLKVYINEPVSLVMICGKDKVKVMGEVLTEPCQKSFDTERIKEQLGKLKSTPFALANASIDTDGKTYLPLPILNELRRKAVEQLLEKRRQKVCRNMQKEDLPELEVRVDFPHLRAMVTTREQQEVCKELGRAYISSLQDDSCQEISCFDRLHDTSNYHVSHNLSTLGIDEALSCYWNVANSDAFRFLRKYTKETIYLSPELSYERCVLLLSNLSKPERVGMMVYGRSDMMITKNCPIAKVEHYPGKGCLSCKKNQYELVDEYDNTYPLACHPYKNDCTIRILNSNRLNLIRYLSRLKDNGVTEFLCVFTDESKEETRNTLQAYEETLNGNEVEFKIDHHTFGAFHEKVE